MPIERAQLNVLVIGFKLSFTVVPARCEKEGLNTESWLEYVVRALEI
jgi:hypothetical protein